jgi:cellulose synthase/poly-beta-1,6-N-acetylglucosamine synthase-like glycosyltransferase
MEKYGGQSNFSVLMLPEEVTGKKSAMSYAMDRLDTEWVFTIDADCVPNTGWIESVMSAADDGVAVTGPVLVKNPRGIFEGFQAMDLLSLALVTGGGMRAGVFTLANGGNMAFNTTAYHEVGGYTRNDEHASGDDVFLMQNLEKRYGSASIRYAQSPHAVTYTWAEPTLKAFISQRRRWASKNAHLPQAAVQRLWGFIWFANFGFLAGVALTITGLLPLPVFILALMMKFGVEYAVLYRIAAHYRLTWQMRYFPTSFVINLIYTTGVALLPLLGSSYVWKGRKTR